MPSTIPLRLLRADDAGPLAELLSDNRAFLAPWEPLRDDDFSTAEGQRDAIARALDAHAAGAGVPLVILDAEGGIAGRLDINGITRGALQSASLGYWVAADRNGRGLATGAVAEAKQIAFAELGLHRLQAETLLHNTASQRVLKKNGFTPYGVAPQYLKIAGEWQDHVLYQVLNEEHEE